METRAPIVSVSLALLAAMASALPTPTSLQAQTPRAPHRRLLGDLDADGVVTHADLAELSRFLDGDAGGSADLRERLERRGDVLADDERVVLADMDLSGDIDDGDRHFLHAFLESRDADAGGVRTRLLALLCGHYRPTELDLERLIQACQSLRARQQRELGHFLVRYLERGGGVRRPSSGRAGGGSAFPARDIACLAVANLCMGLKDSLKERVSACLITGGEARSLEEETRTMVYDLRGVVDEGHGLQQRTVGALRGYIAATLSTLDAAKEKIPALPESLTPLPAEATAVAATVAVPATVAAGPRPSPAPSRPERPPPSRDYLTTILLALVFAGAGAGTLATLRRREPPRQATHPTRALSPEAYLRNKQYEKAIKEFQRQLQDPFVADKSSVRLGLALAFVGQGQAFAAQTHANEADLTTTELPLTYELARAFERCGRRDEALRILRVVYGRDVGFRDVAQRIEALEQEASAPLLDTPALERYLAPRYGDLRLVGRGAMGVVFRTRDRQERRDVALKIISPLAGEDSAMRRRFGREVQALGGLKHEGIVSVIDVHSGDIPYYTMELVEGTSLDELITSGELSGDYDRVARIALSIVEALAYAHEQGVLHRDIKPPNIIVHHHTQVKILDFGLADVLDATRVTKTRHVVGTPLYMAPEVLEGKRPHIKSEVFSFGVLLYEMATGQAPRTLAQLRPGAMAEVAAPAEAKPSCPDELSRLTMRCLAEAPEDRFPDFSVLCQALGQLVEHRS